MTQNELAPESADQDLVSAMRSTVPELSEQQLNLLLGYRDLVFETNQHLNLTSVRDRDEMGRRLILESLRLVSALREAIDNRDAPTVLDLGTGGGIPGVPLAIAFPEIPFTLLDATRKKLDAVKQMTDRLGLTNVAILHGRAEELGHDPHWRGYFSAITARAVSSLPALVELGLPLLKLHGMLLLPKGIDIDGELHSGREAGKIVGGHFTKASILPENGSCIETTLVVVEKIRTTPMLYPRRSGLPSRQPLGVES